MDNSKVIPVKVALRIRPLVPREKAEACNECIRTIPGLQQVILGKDKNFSFDYVFAQSSPQVEIYETSVQPLLTHLYKGYNATVLAYGQTGSGKTHTMGSGYASLSVAATAGLRDEACVMVSTLNHMHDFDNVGVIPRVLNDLFAHIDEETTTHFCVRVSFVEIYNEDIKDLFAERTPGVTVEPLNIREENNSIRVVNLSEVRIFFYYSQKIANRVGVKLFINFR
jgi:kinesin family protein 4/21/27